MGFHIFVGDSQWIRKHVPNTAALDTVLQETGLILAPGFLTRGQWHQVLVCCTNVFPQLRYHAPPPPRVSWVL